MVRTPRVSSPDLEQLGTEKFNSLVPIPIWLPAATEGQREEGAIALGP